MNRFLWARESKQTPALTSSSSNAYLLEKSRRMMLVVAMKMFAGSANDGPSSDGRTNDWTGNG